MPLTSIQQIFDQVPVFVLVLFRLAGMVALAPLLGSTAIPIKIRLMLVLVLSFAVFPLVKPVAAVPNSYAGLAVAIGGEMLIGITMGFALSLLFLGIQLGAEMVSYQMGLSLARLVDPMTDVSTTVLSQLYLLLTVLIYVLENGHLILISRLAYTFQTIPLLSGFESQPVLDMCVVIITESFQLGIRIAGPAVVALFLSSLAMGFVSRTMPQFNILAAGFPIRITLGLVVLIASFGMVPILFKSSLTRVFAQIGEVFM